MTAQDVIARYGLGPHPEGGFYREIHRSARRVGVPFGYSGERVALTAIYFLLARGDFSAFHRVRSEEAWVHLAGAPLELVTLDEETVFCHLSNAADGGNPVGVVPAGKLQAARSLGDWTLSACFVAPGFEFDDFEVPERGELLALYASHTALIERFTR